MAFSNGKFSTFILSSLLCFALFPTSNASAGLEDLPPNIIREIAQHLDSVSKVNLSRACKSTHEAMNPLIEEEHAVTEAQKDPNEFLDDMFHESQILALGESNHNNTRIFEYLRTLLEKEGENPYLKFIALERGANTAAFFEALSSQPLSEELKNLLPNPRMADRFLEGSSMAADPYLMNEILPLIRKINLKRKDNPLLVIPIDGWGKSGDEATVIDRNSQAIRPLKNDQLNHGLSWNRENATSEHFTQLMSKLPKNGKTIVVYHLFHLIQGVEATLPKVNHEKKRWEASSERHPASWLGMYLKKHPQWREKTKIIFFDEKDASKNGNWAPDGTFKFIARQDSLHPGKSFAIPLALIKGKVVEKGLNTIQPTAKVLEWFRGLLFSNADISELADGIIWSPDAHLNSQGAFYNGYKK